jgi:hypothetical protein
VGDEVIGREAALDPCFESGADVMLAIGLQGRGVQRLAETRRSGASLAVGHSRHHEQSIEAERRMAPACLAHDPLIIFKTAARSDHGVSPAEIGEDLAAVRAESMVIRGVGIDRSPRERGRSIDAGVEGGDRPTGLVLQQIAKRLGGKGELRRRLRIRVDDPARPIVRNRRGGRLKAGALD